jgi:hypothetical protein
MPGQEYDATTQLAQASTDVLRPMLTTFNALVSAEAGHCRRNDGAAADSGAPSSLFDVSTPYAGALPHTVTSLEVV